MAMVFGYGSAGLIAYAVASLGCGIVGRRLWRKFLQNGIVAYSGQSGKSSGPAVPAAVRASAFDDRSLCTGRGRFGCRDGRLCETKRYAGATLSGCAFIAVGYQLHVPCDNGGKHADDGERPDVVFSQRFSMCIAFLSDNQTCKKLMVESGGMLCGIGIYGVLSGESK